MLRVGGKDRLLSLFSAILNARRARLLVILGYPTSIPASVSRAVEALRGTLLFGLAAELIAIFDIFGFAMDYQEGHLLDEEPICTEYIDSFFDELLALILNGARCDCPVVLGKPQKTALTQALRRRGVTSAFAPLGTSPLLASVTVNSCKILLGPHPQTTISSPGDIFAPVARAAYAQLKVAIHHALGLPCDPLDEVIKGFEERAPSWALDFAFSELLQHLRFLRGQEWATGEHIDLSSSDSPRLKGIFTSMQAYALRCLADGTIDTNWLQQKAAHGSQVHVYLAMLGKKVSASHRSFSLCNSLCNSLHEIQCVGYWQGYQAGLAKWRAASDKRKRLLALKPEERKEELSAEEEYMADLRDEYDRLVRVHLFPFPFPIPPPSSAGRRVCVCVCVCVCV
jgi:hypothetical protein